MEAVHRLQQGRRVIVFCGINPGFRSAEAGAHFANARNDFWRLLADSGLTPRPLEPEEQLDMLASGFGLTNAAYRTTRRAPICVGATSRGRPSGWRRWRGNSGRG
jgi:G:T/U-mismatch repair DNA glycosylase